MTWHVTSARAHAPCPPQVSDFNLSRNLESTKAASTVLLTNPRWLAPCVLSGLPGQLAADVWAFGTVRGARAPGPLGAARTLLPPARPPCTHLCLMR